MPPAAPAAAAGGADGQQQQQPQRGGFFQGLIRMVIMWYIMRQFQGGGQKGAQPGGQGTGAQLAPLLPRGALVDVHMYSSSNVFSSIKYFKLI